MRRLAALCLCLLALGLLMLVVGTFLRDVVVSLFGVSLIVAARVVVMALS